MNKVILMGRLTRDPEVRYSAGDNSTAVARYTLAVNRRFKRDNEPTADFVPCVAFGKEQEFAESKRDGNAPVPQPADAGDGFMNIPDGIEDNIPFN